MNAVASIRMVNRVELQPRRFNHVVAAVRRRRVPLLCGLIAVACAMAFSLLDYPVLHGISGWVVADADDLWGGWRAAADLTYPDRFQYLFTADPALRTAPGWLVLTAPVARVAAGLGYNRGDPHQTAWLIAGPLFFSSIVLFFCAADTWMHGVALSRRLVVFLAAGIALPQVILFGHPEDIAAISCAMFALNASRSHRASAAGWWMGVALGMQFEAVLIVPLCLALLTRKEWWSLIFRAFIVPLSLVIVPLYGEPSTTISALLQHQFLMIPRWASPLTRFIPVSYDGVSRFVALFPATAMGIWIARRRVISPDVLVWAVAILLCLRLFDMGFYPYYLGPAVAMLVVAASFQSWWKLAAVAGLAIGLTWAFRFPVEQSWWRWAAFLAVFGLMVGLARPATRGRQPGEGDDGTLRHEFEGNGRLGKFGAPLSGAGVGARDGGSSGRNARPRIPSPVAQGMRMILPNLPPEANRS